MSGGDEFSNLGELNSPFFFIFLEISLGLFVGLVLDVMSFRFENLDAPIFFWPDDKLNKLISEF